MGRRTECETLDRQLQRIRAGESSVQVLRGEAGVGKTALLEYVAGKAAGCRIARVAGVQSEMPLAFAGLHQLCAPMLDKLDGLPGPQQHALRVAFGLEDGNPPENFLVALAVLSLLAEAAEAGPLVCLVDDTQWLDSGSAQALVFVARRLLAERIAIVLAVREPGDAQFDGLPEIVVDGIGDADARVLLESGLRRRLDDRVLDRIVAETRGNPLALLELPRDLTTAEMAGGFGLPDPAHLSRRIERSFLRRFELLPLDSQRLVLVAAAEPVGDVTLLWRATDGLGIGSGAAEPAESAGLVELGARVRFHHPLVRSAVYRAASLHDRQDAHRALAEATDPNVDPDRQAWHRAQATVGPDEAVANELERSADRAQGRGGIAAAAAFLERAAELTEEPARRGGRALAAAQAKLDAGAPEAAYALLTAAEVAPLAERERALLQRLRAEIAFARDRGSDAPPLLFEAAQRLVSLDARLARDTCLEALAAVIFADRPGDSDPALEIARATFPQSSPASPADLLLNGLATRVIEGYAAGAPSLRDALEAFRDEAEDADDNRWLWLACRVASDLFEHEIWGELATRAVRLAREAGALSVLPLAANYLAGAHVHAGEYGAAATLNEESLAITRAAGTAPLLGALPMATAYRGDEAEALRLIDAGRQDAAAKGRGTALSMMDCARAVLFNGLGRYEEARTAAEHACAHQPSALYGLALVELVEAAVRSDQPERAAGALERLSERARASGTDWALGLEARSRALLAAGPDAGGLYEEAIERLSRGRLAPHRARSQLLYGEWLRREKRRVDAREQLRLAFGTFSSIGAAAFAERARRELLATGETVRRRSDETRDVLTPQEAQIARLAVDGRTNPEIGAQLFLSPRTVEWHLGKVFSKLGIRSRRQLRRALTIAPERAGAGA